MQTRQIAAEPGTGGNGETPSFRDTQSHAEATATAHFLSKYLVMFPRTLNSLGR